MCHFVTKLCPFDVTKCLSNVAFSIHSSLIPCNNANLTNPVVRLYLLPDRSSCTKHKTQVQKGTLNPVFDETLVYIVTC